MDRNDGPLADWADTTGRRKVERLVSAHCRIREAPPVGDEIGFLCSTFVRFSLPHRAVAGNTFERRDGERLVTFMSPPSIGLPFGTWPRMLLIYLTTQAVRSQEREVDLGASMSAFMKSLHASVSGGRSGSIGAFKDQLLRTASLSATLSQVTAQGARLQSSPIADELDICWVVIGKDKRSGLPARIRLGERMFDQMLHSAVPLDMRAVRVIRQSPLAFDMYAWLTYRAPRLAATHTTRIAWSALRAQFGSGYATESDFRIAFRNSLAQVQLVYPSLRCDASGSHLALRRSPASVPRRAVAL